MTLSRLFLACSLCILASPVAAQNAKALTDGEYGVAHVPQLSAASTQPSFAPPIWDFGIYAEGKLSEKK